MLSVNHRFGDGSTRCHKHFPVGGIWRHSVSAQSLLETMKTITASPHLSKAAFSDGFIGTWGNIPWLAVTAEPAGIRGVIVDADAFCRSACNSVCSLDSSPSTNSLFLLSSSNWIFVAIGLFRAFCASCDDNMQTRNTRCCLFRLQYECDFYHSQ